MPASYPAATAVFTAPVDRVSTVWAGDVIQLQEEVVAIEDTLGTSPATSALFPAVTTVAQRFAYVESTFDGRLDTLEELGREAAVSLERGSPELLGSSLNWSTLAFPNVVTGSVVNDFPNTLLYDATAGRVYPVAPAASRWAISVSVTWEGQAQPAGRRGLRILGSDGRVFGQERRSLTSADDETLTVTWTGTLPPVESAYFLRAQVFQDSGVAVNVLGNSNVTPTRLDFTHLPG